MRTQSIQEWNSIRYNFIKKTHNQTHIFMNKYKHSCSDAIIASYNNMPSYGLQSYFTKIQEWLNGEEETSAAIPNLPLLIQGQPGSGKKHLMVKWANHHHSIKQKSRNDLVLMSFSGVKGVNGNYYDTLYQFLIKLRQQLHINQKVEIHEQKLRKYFSYWLQICNQRMEHQLIQDMDNIYTKIVLVFQGIDYYSDKTTTQQGNIAFWLPKQFPANVKVIVTATSGSKSAQYFHNLGCPTISLSYEPSASLILSNYLHTTQPSLHLQSKNPLFVKTIATCFSMSSVPTSYHSHLKTFDYHQLQSFKTLTQLFQFLIQFWKNTALQTQQHFKQFLCYMINTQKGLTIQQLSSLLKLKPQSIIDCIKLFSIFIINYQGLYMIKNQSFTKVITRKLQLKPNNVISFNQKIAQILRKTPNSVRKLEQETFQLYSAGNYFRLKQVISDIENFLLLFNPATKYDLCKYWQKLQERSFDPVIEYNKAIQGFQTHYHPTPENLFRIITQISRFLKQFSDFETYSTPQFKHPKLIGNPKQLDDIGILKQLYNLDLCEDQLSEVKISSVQLSDQQDRDTSSNKIKKKLKQMYLKISQGRHIKRNNTSNNNSNNNGQQTKMHRQMRKQHTQRVQQLNVQVKSNEESFRKIYYQQIKPFLKKVGLDGDKDMDYIIDQQSDDFQDSDGDQPLKQKPKSQQHPRQKSQLSIIQLKNLYAYTIQEQFELSQKAPTNYYYKRWIWMQFPWVCMTIKCDFSQKLRKCFLSPTSYMSVQQQRQFTQQALVIALQAKKKKQAILQKRQTNSKTKGNENKGAQFIHSKLDNDDSFDDDMDSQPFTLQSNNNNISNNNNSLAVSCRKLDINLHKSSSNIISIEVINSEIQAMQKIKKNSSTNIYQEIINSNNISNNNSVFITSQDKVSRFSSTVKDFKKKQVFGEVANSNTMKQPEGALPRIKQFAKNQMLRQLNHLQGNNMSIRKQVDQYLYRNQQLMKRLLQLKTIYSNNQAQYSDDKKYDEKARKTSQIQIKIDRVKMQYAYSLLEHQRLDVLIKICKRNKTHNQQAIPGLALQCNNFKKMIRIQTQAIQLLKHKTSEIKKLTKQFIQNCKNKAQNQVSLSHQIKQTVRAVQNFQLEVSRYDQIIKDQKKNRLNKLTQRPIDVNNTINNNNNNINNNSVNNNNNSNNSINKNNKNNSYSNCKNTPKDKQQYQQMIGLTHRCNNSSSACQQSRIKVDVSQLQKLIDLDVQDCRNTPQFQRLLNGLNKKRQLTAAIEQKKLQLQEMNKKCAAQKSKLKKMKRQRQQTKSQANQYYYQNNGHQQISAEKQVELKRRTLDKLTSQKLACLGVINTWCSRLNLPQQENLQITPQLLQKLIQLKHKS